VNTTLGEKENSISLLIKGIDLRRDFLGERHPLYAKALQILAGAFLIQGRYDDSLEFFEKCLEIKLDVFGYESVEVAEIFHSIAGLHFIKGEVEEGKDNLSTAIEIRKAVLSQPDPLTIQLEGTLNLYLQTSPKN
jgi:tetratricopeptide (TPR) repeat protein